MQWKILCATIKTQHSQLNRYETNKQTNKNTVKLIVLFINIFCVQAQTLIQKADFEKALEIAWWSHLAVVQAWCIVKQWAGSLIPTLETFQVVFVFCFCFSPK